MSNYLIFLVDKEYDEGDVYSHLERRERFGESTDHIDCADNLKRALDIAEIEANKFQSSVVLFSNLKGVVLTELEPVEFRTNDELNQ